MSLRERSAELLRRMRRIGRAWPRSVAAAALGLAGLAAFAGCAPGEAQVDNGRSEAASSLVTAKPTAAFALDHEVDAIPSVGVPLELRLILRPQSSAEDIVVQLSTDAGLQLTSTGAVLSAPTATQEAPAEWVVTVVPMQEGRFHVKVYAEALIQGSRQGRSIMVPIRVAGETATAGGRKSPQVQSSNSAGAGENGEAEPAPKDEDSERLLRLPAEERR